MTARPHPLRVDLDEVLARAAAAWQALTGARVFITGGTGFFGCWLLETLTWAVDRLALDLRAVVLTRDPEAFARKAPHLAGHRAVTLVRGDTRDFAFPDGAFSHAVHAATAASAALNRDQPALMAATVVDGTRRCLEFVDARGIGDVLLTSSGAIYGPQPPALAAVPEEHLGGPDPLAPGSAYGEAKRYAELLAAIAAMRGTRVKIARCWAFVGPYLDLEAHFAIGNFIRDGLRGGPIRVGGDGTPLRSYLYAGDLAAWLWTLLTRAPSARAYNVGSASAISIADLAHTVARSFTPAPTVTIATAQDPTTPIARYVPDVARAARELDLQAWTPLDEAIRRTVAWHRHRAP